MWAWEVPEARYIPSEVHSHGWVALEQGLNLSLLLRALQLIPLLQISVCYCVFQLTVCCVCVSLIHTWVKRRDQISQRVAKLAPPNASAKHQYLVTAQSRISPLA